jgi:hypothetical protein
MTGAEVAEVLGPYLERAVNDEASETAHLSAPRQLAHRTA